MRYGQVLAVHILRLTRVYKKCTIATMAAKTGPPHTEKKIWAMFGNYVRRLRESKGLGLREMSERAKERTNGRGLSPTYLSRIEHGDTAPPRRAVLKVMADILEVSEMRLDLVAQGWAILELKTIWQAEGEQQRTPEKSDEIASLLIPRDLLFGAPAKVASRALGEIVGLNPVWGTGQIPTLGDLDKALERLRSKGFEAKFEASAGELLLAVREQE